ncbi:ribonuclease E [Nocardioides cavernae]|uniref:Ribonuclease E n=1 Tax=Nocardioides cavernae TaxID=1921566 RepID=A0A7Y9KQ16_9ACTN|nr:Rne/Rng family ribonuclease [Nocardioides cavernae]NYE35099.1 ribonuclease E [Nocardioides cavernae]
MLDEDQPDRTETSTETGGTADAPAAPQVTTVTRRTRKAPARKTAAATEPAAGDSASASVDAPAGGPADEAPAPAKKAAARKSAAKKAPAKRAAAKKTAAPADAEVPDADAPSAEVAADAAPAKPARKTAARKSAAKKTTRKAAAAEPSVEATTEPTTEPATDAEASGEDAATGHAVLFQAPVVTTTTRRSRKKPAPVPVEVPEVPEAAAAVDAPAAEDEAPAKPARKAAAKKTAAKKTAEKTPGRRTRKAVAPEPVLETEDEAEDETEDQTAEQLAADAVTEATGDDAETTETTEAGETTDADSTDDAESTSDDADGEGGPARRRRRRGGRRRRKGSDGSSDAGPESGEGSDDQSGDAGETAEASGADDNGSGPDSPDGNGDGSSRRRRRRRRAGDDAGSDDDDPNTVTRVRKSRSAEDQITAVSGSTRLEAKKQRRREGREAGRRRAPIVSEAEFLARRESVERVMVIRQREDLIQIGVLEDKVLVEHYVARESQTSLIGNVYLGRVQNVLPSMEAAFIDIGKGRNAVLYAGEVNWASLGHKEGQPRKIESVLSSGQMILVQVTKDPIGHKGARLTSQVSLAGRFLVYVPDGTTSGISRKLPDTERNRLKTLLKEIVPDTAGVIVRTAAEGASEEELTRDVERLKARWEDIEKKATHKGSGPQLLYGEPDLTLKVVRDLFTEDFSKLVIEGDDAWDTVHGYVESVAPDLAERVEKYERNGAGDVFSTYRIDEQIHKGLDRKVWLPSGGSLVIDRTEAMTVVDVNTGKFTGSGGNLEETVTKNNLEAAEEIVRQLRLRDIGGIIVVDFIDMVLESNRDLVVRRLVECLGRDRTRHQVAEVTSLGLVQMTRKRIGTGLLESFSENCEHCHGRGVVIKDQPVDPHAKSSDDSGDGKRGSRRRGRRGSSNGDDNGNGNGNGNGNDSKPAEPQHAPSPKDVAAMAHKPAEPTDGEQASEASEASEAPADTAADTAADAPQVEAQLDSHPEAQPEPTEPAAETPVETPVEPAAETPVEAPTEPEKPRVVTRTRRRSASRPAGPPAVPATSGAGRVPVSGVVEPGTVDVEPGVGTPLAEEAAAEAPAGAADEAAADAPSVEHVPIKKKGSRKR